MIVSSVFDVYYDRQTPTHSVLQTKEDLLIDGRASLAVGGVFLVRAIYLALPG